MIPSVGPFRGGPSVAMRTLARSLARVGVEVDVATTDDDGPGRLDVPLGCPVSDGDTTYWYFRRQTRFYTVSWPLTRWLSAHVREYDLVHIHALFSYATLPASVYARRYGVPYVVRPLGTLNRFGMEQRRPLLKRLSFGMVERRILAGAARVHYTSEAERREAALLQAPGRATVIPHGIDVGAFRKRAASGWIRRRAPHLAGRTTILFLSRIDPKKGLDLLLSAFARVRSTRSDVGLVIAGDGDPAFVGKLRGESERLGLADAVYWAGLLDDHEKRAALADADLFVLPSYSENFGLAVVEAMASRLPVVVSDQVGIHHEVVEGSAGLVIPCEVPALATALATLIANPPLRRRLGEGAGRLAETRFSAEAMAHAVLGLYREIVGAPRPARMVASR
ncbi:MAG TPA: glycosyltransferase [Candidatus Acidoferrum sp.]|nr:glycosyltransferase [Candidatus Acidoferrum sp.]